MRLPLMYQVRQKFYRHPNLDLLDRVQEELGRARFWGSLPREARVAVTAGSRGITGIAQIIQAVVGLLLQKGMCPFVLPAMGSHGGGTTAGQLAVLAGLGITTETMGAPVMSTIEVVQLGNLSGGVPVYLNKYAAEADGIIVVNRVKPHPSFRGPVESGLCKMLVIGLGNPTGAESLHRFGPQGLREMIPPAAALITERAPVLYGLAILEGAVDETVDICGTEPEDFAATDQRLLSQARELMPRLPFNNIDLLIVEEMGKCFSGTGMDTNVIGRIRILGEPEPEDLTIKRLVVLDLAEASHGNANGIGLADFTTRRLADKIDWPTTYRNVLTTTFFQRAMLPLVFKDDREAIITALTTLRHLTPEEARVVRIKNTLQLENIEVSEALIPETQDDSHLAVSGRARRLRFNRGRLV